MIARALAALAIFLCGAGVAAAQEPTRETVIHAGRLLADPSTGLVAANQSILIGPDGRISGVEPGFVRPEGARIVDLSNAFVLPGLIDSHVHLDGELGPRSRLEAVTDSEADVALRAAHNAELTLMAGFTTVADLGSERPEAIFALRDAIARGEVIGPRVLAAGGAITPHGGHADINGYGPEVMHALARETACSGADDCRRATRRMIQDGADIIKITATGGVLSNTAAGLAQQLTDEELRAIVETAHAMRRRVTAHAHGVDGINAALRAGVDSIEHGSYLDAQSIRLFRQHNAWLVPTVIAGVYVNEIAQRPDSFFTPAQRAKALLIGPLMVDMARRAHEGHVRIAFGTDTGVSPHGQNAREFDLLVQAGFTPLEAVQAATVGAAEHLRLSETAGRIAPGLSADIIATANDPIIDVSALRSIAFVMARGAVVKGP